MITSACLWHLHLTDEDYVEEEWIEAFGAENKFWGVNPNPEIEFMSFWALTPDKKNLAPEQEAIIDRFYYSDEYWDKPEDLILVAGKYGIA